MPCIGSGQIEVSIDVVVSAGVSVNVDRAWWGRASDEAKRQRIGAAIDMVQLHLDGDVMLVDVPTGTYLAAQIVGPETIDLRAVSVYDPEE